MYHYNKDICSSICKKNAVIYTAGLEVVTNLKQCKCDCNRDGMVYGKITNQYGQPVKYAIVKIVSNTYQPVRIAKSDHQGNYVIFSVLSNRPYKIIATAEDCCVSDEINICMKEQEVLNVDLFLCCDNCEEIGVLTGTVLDKLSSLSIEAAQVVLFEEQNGENYYKNRTETNACGEFVFARLAPGTYLVQIHRSGYIDEQYKVCIGECGQIVNHVISLCPDSEEIKGTVSGVITDCHQKPVADADVILYRIGCNNEIIPIAYTKTNTSGVYLFINVEIGSYKVVAQ